MKDPSYARLQGMPEDRPGLLDPDQWGKALAVALQRNPGLATNAVALGGWFTEFGERHAGAIREATEAPQALRPLIPRLCRLTSSAMLAARQPGSRTCP